MVLDALLSSGVRVDGCYDSNPALAGKEIITGVRVAGNMNDAARARGNSRLIVIAIGENRVRRRLDAFFGGGYGKVVAPSTVIGSGVRIGDGAMVMPSATVNIGTAIGKHAILNTSCSVDHDCVIGDYAHVAPGSHLGGNVTIGEGTFLGIGVKVIPGVRIGRWSIVGAGAVVTEDLPDNCTAVGIPAKNIKVREDGWHLM